MATKLESTETTESINCEAVRHYSNLVTEYLNDNCKIEEQNS